jgi:EAL domain-containing protein (putative c-di-GMP-specific phosphodiesterase class I)
LSLCIHLNLSAKDLQDPTLINKSVSLVNGNHSSQKIMFEITESAMMTNVAQAKDAMTQITAAGGAFSIDDFGTGFSSLELLRDLPVTQIKIDGSFINSIHHSDVDLAIVKSVIFLSQHLNCNVVAEGVENSETATLLASLGCDLAQGYYYSKPMPMSSFAHYIQVQQSMSTAV